MLFNKGEGVAADFDRDGQECLSGDQSGQQVSATERASSVRSLWQRPTKSLKR